MMTEVLVRKRLGGIEPASEEAFKVLGRIGTGAEFWIDIRDPRRRSTEQHNFWFAMVTQMFENQSYFKQFDHFRHAMLVKMGYRHEYQLKDGTPFYEPKSLKFGKMPQEEFTALVDDTLNFAEDMGFNRDDLLQYTRERAGVAA